MSVVKWNKGTLISVPFSGNGINSLPNNSIIGSSGIDTGSSDLSILAEVEGIITMPVNTAPALYSSISIWFLRTLDNSNWEFASNSGMFTPARMPDVVLPLMAVHGQQRVVQQTLIPPGNFKAWVKNDGTGVTLAGASGDIRLRPLSYQIV